MKTIKNILVPVDLSAYSYHALDYALDLAEMYAYDAKITLLHVLDRASITMFSNLYITSGEILGDVEGTAREVMEEKVGKYDKSKFSKVSISVIWGNPYKEIVDFAEENQMDIIIMSTHTKPGLAHFFLGSVTEKVVRYSDIPVLTVRPERVKNNLMKPIIEESHLA